MKMASKLKLFVPTAMHLSVNLVLIAITGRLRSELTSLVLFFALDYFEQNINGHIFYDWCKHALLPSLKTKCVIVMDNASFHKRVQRSLNRHGHRILRLLPYIPDLNPIEKKYMFYLVKLGY